jgi:uncharacterized membrane protein YeaQ/YmgE (transglycosylase-associated protein family)
MGLLAWVVVGAIAGWLASVVMGGSGFGLIGDIVVGAIGAVVGGWLASTFFHMPGAISGINVQTIVVAFLGAVVVLFVARALRH